MESIESDSESLEAQHFDVTIIGAGVAGSMAALLCARAGLRTLLVDRQSFPRSKVCGGCLNGRSLEILKRSGLESGLRQLEPTTTSSLSLRFGSRQLNVPVPVSFAVSRRSLDQWLVNEAVAAGCRFMDDVAATVDPLSSEVAENRPDSLDDALSEYGHLPQKRTVILQRKHPTGDAGQVPSLQRIESNIVLACDGLGHPSLHRLSAFRAIAAPGSRIGLGAVFPRTAADEWMRCGDILMVISKLGYVGVVEIENRQLNLAAAVDPEQLHETHSPFACVKLIFRSAGVQVPAELKHTVIKGTLPLTRTAERIAGHRLFLVGDATGYVEPFTGEGMAWALTAAEAIVPLVVTAVRDQWSNKLITEWQTIFRGIVRQEQQFCRLLAAALRRPWLLPPILTMCQLFPSLTQRLVTRINRVPEALENAG